jgi:D-arabinose 1-dehydrogenase-like Zn-dependent alcohol dehydrogenase
VKAVVLHEVGPPENLRLEELPRPEVTPAHVLVKVRAAGVCHRDVVDRRGGFPFMKRPVIPGHELAGEVVAVGEGVTGLAPGDRVVNLHRAPCGDCAYCRAGHEPRCLRSAEVFGLTVDGCYADYVLAHAGCLLPLPAAVPYEEGCFLACTAGVALRGLRARAGLVAGESVLVTGASGGVGLHALQVARALGARTLAVTSSPAKADALAAAGADEVIVSTDGAFHKPVRARGGVDVVLDCVGAPTLNASIRSVKPMGRVVVLGNVTIERAEVNPGLFILSEITLQGSSGCGAADLRDVLAWVESGRLRPVLAETLPLAAAPEAHRRLEAKAVTGRLVLLP